MTTFKVMTWNIENLYRVGNPAGPKTKEEYAAKLESLAHVILELDADVLAVQEVGQEAAFDDLLALLKDRYPHTRLSLHPDPRGIRVGFLSKLVIEASEDLVDFPAGGLPAVPGVDGRGNLISVTTFGRGALRIQVSPQPDFAVQLFTAHLKSKLLTFPGGRTTPRSESERARIAGISLLKRAAEATALRVLVNQVIEGNATERLLLLGDLNDVPEAATTQLLQGPPGSEIGTAGFQRRDRGDDARLFNLGPLISEARRYSRVYRDKGELIDHIFASQEFFPGQPRRLPEVDSHVNFTDVAESITENFNERRGKPGSDHAPVTAIFDL
jgi:endonuclease/exonuclease/phosphatase family metal-dependent hydrolase